MTKILSNKMMNKNNCNKKLFDFSIYVLLTKFTLMNVTYKFVTYSNNLIYR